MPFDKILVFNRGEIACRIIRTARDLGFRTVAVHAGDEHQPLHADLADEAVLIGADRSAYLSATAAVQSALKTGAQALHPGYGFLSESPALARACEAAGLTFIGPPAAAIEAMGDKAAARRLMQAAGVRCVPGYDGEAQDDRSLSVAADRIGWPLMVKAAAGGGGKGMRRVERADQLGEALGAARSEARAAFGAERLILERALMDVRHVEIQIFADAHGEVVHLGERDCSVQRRHQKVIEETPSPALAAALREAMGAAAIVAARTVGYRGAGTVEFLVEPSGEFYFLEMNTRLQVEHPVTEAVTGLDLVAWQIRVAAGGALPLGQADVRFEGAAMEARIYAETPDLAFLPRAGVVSVLHLPSGTGVRVDHALRPGTTVSPHYDPLLAKVVAHGADREEARRRLLRALEDLFIGGVETNRGLLIRILRNPAFAAGSATTSFLQQQQSALAPPPATESDLALANLVFDARPGGTLAAQPLRARRRLSAGGSAQLVVAEPLSAGGWRMGFESGAVHDVALVSRCGDRLRYVLDDLQGSARICWAEDRLQLALPDGDLFISDARDLPQETQAVNEARSPMAGRVVSVHVAVGDTVQAGDPVAIVEAMKMEHEIRAALCGEVVAVWAEPGQEVPRDFLIAEVAG